MPDESPRFARKITVTDLKPAVRKSESRLHHCTPPVFDDEVPTNATALIMDTVATLTECLEGHKDNSYVRYTLLKKLIAQVRNSVAPQLAHDTMIEESTLFRKMLSKLGNSAEHDRIVWLHYFTPWIEEYWSDVLGRTVESVYVEYDIGNTGPVVFELASVAFEIQFYSRISAGDLTPMEHLTRAHTIIANNSGSYCAPSRAWVALVETVLTDPLARADVSTRLLGMLASMLTFPAK